MNYKVMSPNKEYNGITASVKFNKGVGETSNSYFAEWFRKNGYTVEEIKAVKEDKKSKDDKKESDKTPGEAEKQLELSNANPDDLKNNAESDKTPGE